jgi:hypothetical protein
MLFYVVVTEAHKVQNSSLPSSIQFTFSSLSKHIPFQGYSSSI